MDESGSPQYAVGIKMGKGNAVINEGESFLQAIPDSSLCRTRGREKCQRPISKCG